MLRAYSILSTWIGLLENNVKVAWWEEQRVVVFFFSGLRNTLGYVPLLIPQSSYVCLNKFFIVENNFAVYNTVRSFSTEKILFI